MRALPRPVRLLLIIGLWGCGHAPPPPQDRPDVRGRLPATFAIDAPHEGEPRELRLAVHLDARLTDAARAAWEEAFDHANALWIPLTGTRLVATPQAPWQPPPTLAEARAALPAPTDDASLVLGVMAVDSPAGDELARWGASGLLEPQLVVRFDAQAPVPAQATAGLPADLAAEVTRAQRKHRHAIVLLHHLARAHGAVHEVERTWVMARTYSASQRTLSGRTRELIERTLADRAEGRTRAQQANALIALIEASEWGGWHTDDRTAVVQALSAMALADRRGRDADELPPAAFAQVERTRGLIGRGDRAAAAAELEALLAAYPAHPTLLLLGCELALAAAPRPTDDAATACARVGADRQGEWRGDFAMARAWARADDLGRARTFAEAVAARLPHRADAKPGWAALVALYRELGALTWTDAAMQASGVEDAAIRAWIDGTRARYGVGVGAVPPADEAAAVREIRTALDDLYANRAAAARTRLRAAASRWPGAAGVLAVQCDLAVRASDPRAGKRACAKAVALQPTASWALYLSGILALGDNDDTGGAAMLERALAVDPELQQAWRALAKAKRRASDAAGLADVRARYQARFGRALSE